jgi:hypothetical protein
MADEPITLRDIVVDSCLIAMTIYSVYQAMDQATNGASSREISMRLTKIKGKIKEYATTESDIRKQIRRMLFSAERIVETDDRDSGFD